MNKTKLLTIFSICISLLIIKTQGYDYYEYEDDDDYDYEYVYEDDDCDDLDGDGYCDDDSGDEYSDSGEGGQPQFGDDERSVTVDLGNTARLTCTVHQLGSQVISWKRGDSFLFLGSSPLTNDERYSVELTDSSSSLTITLVSPQDAGDFKCQVASSQPMEQIFSIEIKAPPNVKILGKPDSGEYVLQEGTELRVKCEGEGDPRPTLSWSRLNSQLPPGLAPPHDASLHFPGISHSDAGIYQCVGNNGFGQPAVDSVQIIVKHKPKIYVHEEYGFNKETEHVDVLKLICSVQAFPRAQTKWNRNDDNLPVRRVNEIIEDGKHILEIMKPRKSDAGVYTCEAGNSEGDISAVLTVDDSEHLTEAVGELLEELPEMIQDKLENSAASYSIPFKYLLCSVLVIVLRNIFG